MPEDVTVTVDVTGESPLATVVYELVLREGAYRVRHFHADGPKGGWLDLEAVRQVPYRRMLRLALASAAAMVQHDGARFTAEWPLTNADPLWDVALTYVIALACSEPPVAAVAEDFKISRPAAAQRIARARRKGYLRPTTQGKAT